jgi:hypothetical protein
MSNDTMGDAFGGLVVLAFDLLDSEIQRSPERLAEILKSPVVLATAQKGLLSFANAKLKSQTTQLSPSDIQKLRAIGDDVLSKAADEYFKQIKKSSAYKSLEKQVDAFKEAAGSSALGVWVDQHKGIVYVVGAALALALGAGAALFVTKPNNGAVTLGLQQLEKLKFEVVKLGALKLGVGGIVFDPTAELVGAKLTGKLKWERLKLDLSLQVVTRSAAIDKVEGEVMVQYGSFELSGIVKKDVAKPTVDLNLKLSATEDRFNVAVAAQVKDGQFGGSASAGYKITKGLDLNAELSRTNRGEAPGGPENLFMIKLTGTFP